MWYQDSCSRIICCPSSSLLARLWNWIWMQERKTSMSQKTMWILLLSASISRVTFCLSILLQGTLCHVFLRPVSWCQTQKSFALAFPTPLLTRGKKTFGLSKQPPIRYLHCLQGDDYNTRESQEPKFEFASPSIVTSTLNAYLTPTQP